VTHVSDSILTSTKKVLGITEDYDAFDVDILMHINSAFATLHQLGVGSQTPFEVEDAEATWDTFLGGDKRLNSVKTYVYLKVRLVFDTPGTSYLIQAAERQIQELEWRLNVAREEVGWTEPLSTLTVDGGNA
jgi:hypothetical protein